MAKSLWNWIANFNRFYFEELWEIDYCIPLKDANLVEIIRGAVLWSLRLDRNRIMFKDGRIHEIQDLDSKIIPTAYFWASQQKVDSTSQLKLIFPCDVKDLIGTTVVVFMEEVQDIIRMLRARIDLDGEDTTQSQQLLSPRISCLLGTRLLICLYWTFCCFTGSVL